MSLQEARLISLPKMEDPRGNLTFVESSRHIPFDIERVFWIYDVPGGENRGAHAHKTLFQFLVAVSGSFKVTVTDGRQHKEFMLSRPDRGLLLVPGLWQQMTDFSSGAACLVLASAPYDEADYFRDYNDFLRYKGILA